MTKLRVNESSPLPWYKQLWPWLLISIPFATVIAGVVTYLVAANQPSSLVEDDYFKKGLAINRSLERENIARSLKIHGQLQLEKNGHTIQLTLAPATQWQPSAQSVLLLTLFHPTQKNRDQHLQLSWLGGNEFVAEASTLQNTNWYFAIEDSDKTWLIKGNWRPLESAIVSF